MSSIASYDTSNELPREAPVQLPPCLNSPMPLSPRTVRMTLQTQSNINNGMLRNIANGLLQMIADRETSTSVATKRYEDCIHHLE
jgi:hypothetical protein